MILLQVFSNRVEDGLIHSFRCIRRRRKDCRSHVSKLIALGHFHKHLRREMLAIVRMDYVGDSKGVKIHP